MRISDWSSDVCSSDLDLPHRSFKFGIMHIESKERSGEFAGHSLQARSSLRVEGKLVALSGRGRGWRLQLKLVHRIASLITQRGLRPARQVQIGRANV